MRRVFSVPVVGNEGFSAFWVLWGLLGACVYGDAGFAGFSLILTGFGLRRCAFLLDSLFGRRSVGTFLRNSRGVSWITQKKVLLVFHWGA